MDRSKSSSPLIEPNISSYKCLEPEHLLMNKLAKFICTHTQCMKKCQLLCETCLEDQHVDHKDNWMELSDFFKRVSNKAKISRSLIQQLPAQKLIPQLAQAREGWSLLVTDLH